MTGTPPQIVLHINLQDLTGWRGRERLGFFDRVATICEQNHLPYQTLPRHADLTRRSLAQPDGHLHLVEDGRMMGEGWLNAALAYLLGFWHLDPHGVLAESGARTETYTPRAVPLEAAQDFFITLRQRFVRTRQSRYGQPRQRDDSLPEGAIALFLQGRKPTADGDCDLTMEEMILAVCQGASGRPVVVKPHPLAETDCARAILRAADRGAVFEVFNGNIHDLLARCAVTVSANSAAAMEGFLHRKPAILFGRSDFESLVTRVHQPGGFADALHRALSTDWRFAKMLYWYFTRHSLDIAAPDFEDRLWGKFAQVGFARSRFGL